jgi:hypothetical protein
VLATCGRSGCVEVSHLRLAPFTPKPRRPTGLCTRCGEPHDRRVGSRGRCRSCDAAYARARYRRRRALIGA